jgi:hypothetical protein
LKDNFISLSLNSIRAASHGCSFLLCFMLLALAAGGCQTHGKHTTNPRLKQIDALLDSQLPKGTPLSRVSFFLNSRGYKTESSSDHQTLVAIVRHVDTETLEPATARVTFHFDSNDKLTTYDLDLIPDAAP